ncbi:MAG: ROK family protein [Erysipelotrichaceae bacterium]|nr:ROK family protein [Erysipelotrichaceae bacterium]
MKKYLALDLGGTAIKYGVLDEELNFSAHGKIDARTDSQEVVFEDLRKIYDEYGEGVEGVCISMPGVIDRKKGFAHTGGAYKWVNKMPIASMLSEEFGVPVTICNDAKSAALAEIGYGNMQYVTNGMCIILGTGIGGAIIVNGNLVDGTHFSSGEFSFLRGHVDDRTNRRDIFYATNGVGGFKAALKKATGLDEIDGLKAFRMIKEDHNEEALQGVKEFCLDLAHHIYNLQAVLDCERVLIGGGISNEPMFIDLVKEAVDTVFDGAFAPVIPKPQVMVCRFQADANLIGAVYNFIELQDLYKENQFINI